MKQAQRERPQTEPMAALNKIVINENGDPLVELIDGEHGIFLRWDRRIWVRKTVAEMLRRAQNSLPAGIHLYVSEGYRSLERQTAIYQGFWAQMVEEHPEWPYSILRRQVNRFVAPPDDKSPPGHCTGGAVDLTLIDGGGSELDMISPRGIKLANSETWSEDLSPHALANRKLLFDAMEGQGFKNYPFEWWHYSYGDSGWAFRKGRKTCFYDAVDPPAEYEAPVS